MSLRAGHVFRPVEDRFASKVLIRDDGCHEWLGRRDRHGYGRLSRGGRKDGSILAHRFAYEQTNGPVPVGLDLDHLCRRPWCVNASHLEAVPHRVNMLRSPMPNMRAHLAGTCTKGHPNGPDPKHCKPCGSAQGRAYRATKRLRSVA